MEREGLGGCGLLRISLLRDVDVTKEFEKLKKRFE